MDITIAVTTSDVKRMAFLYRFYILLYLIPIIICLSIPVVVLVIPTCIAIYRCKVRKTIFTYKAHEIVRNLFSKGGLKAGPQDSEEKPETLLFGFVVPQTFIYQILLFSVVICFVSLAIFWDTFLFEVSYLCNPDIPDLHCFSGKSLSEHELNCSNTDYLEQNNYSSFECYQFVFDFSNAAGNAGGVFTMSSVVFGVSTWLLLSISNGAHGSKKQKIATFCIQTTSMIFATFGVIVGPIAVSFIGNAIHYDFKITQIIQAVVLFSIILLTLGMPWYWFKKPNNLNQRNPENEEKYESIKNVNKDKMEMSSTEERPLII